MIQITAENINYYQKLYNFLSKHKSKLLEPVRNALKSTTLVSYNYSKKNRIICINNYNILFNTKIPKNTESLTISEINILSVGRFCKKINCLYIRNCNAYFIQKLPKHLTILHIDKNNIKYITKLPKNLRSFNISDIVLKIFPKLPKSLEIIHIKKFNFHKLPKLPKKIVLFNFHEFKKIYRFGKNLESNYGIKKSNYTEASLIFIFPRLIVKRSVMYYKIKSNYNNNYAKCTFYYYF